MSFDLSNKVAVVTGASKGIGRSIAIKLAKLGCFVFVVNRNESTGIQLVEEIKNFGGEAQQITADVSKEEDCKNIINSAIEHKGKIDILVNNAGITQDNIFMRMKNEEWDSVMRTNLDSVFYLCRQCVRPMMKAKGGRIINISSVVAHTGNPGQVNYSASKSALIGFTKSLAKEIASRQITCNVISPGFIETGMTGKLTEDQKNTIVSNIPMGHVGKPKDIADGVAFLASDNASYITGTVLHINGGLF